MKLEDLALALHADLQGETSLEVFHISPLTSAQAGDLTFVLEKKFIPMALISPATAFVTFESIPGLANQIVVPHPKKALTQTIALFFPDAVSLTPPPHSHTAIIHPSAVVSPSAVIGPFAVIGDQVVIGDHTIIHSHVVIGSRCTIGRDCVIHPHVTLYNDITVHDRVVIHAGAVIGADGFGYYLDKGRWCKVPQVGGVDIQSDVEIGANTGIDRGCIGNTTIGTGTKIDNSVQIGHNDIIGNHCMIAAQVGLVGSCELQDYVVMGGQAGANAVVIGSGSQIAAKAGVTKDCPPKSIWSGFPAWDHRDDLKKEILVRKLVKENSKKKDHAP